VYRSDSAMFRVEHGAKIEVKMSFSAVWTGLKFPEEINLILARDTPSDSLKLPATISVSYSM